MITWKDLKKLFGLVVISCCATLVCYLFLNYQFDLSGIEKQMLNTSLEPLYKAKLTISKVVVALSGGSLGFIAIIMLFFYCKQFIDNHRQELGILKAHGYSNWEISRQFTLFASSILVGSSFAILIAQGLLKTFYAIQSKSDTSMLPAITPKLHLGLISCLILIPTVLFSLLAFFYTIFQLRISTVRLLKNQAKEQKNKGSKKAPKARADFLQDVKRTNLLSTKRLLFFVWFSGFTFATMLNLAFGMTDLADEWVSYLMLIIGLVLTYTILVISLSSLIDGQGKTIAMLRVFGYNKQEIYTTILSPYRPIAYIGFLVGTIYQYGLMNGLLYFLRQNVPIALTYDMNWQVVLFVFLLFLISYEAILFLGHKKITRVSLKLIMMAD